MQRFGKTISYTSGSIAANIVSLAFGSYIQFYYTDTLRGDVTWIGIAMMIQTIYATLVYPCLGYLSDCTNSRWGRRVPFILFGAIPLGVSFILVWIPPVSSVHVLLFTAYFLLTAILYDTLFNLTMVNWSALFPELFRSSRERALASAWKQMFGIVGLVAGLALSPMLSGMLGWPVTSVIFGVICTASLLLTIPSMELKRRRLLREKADENGNVPTLPIVKALSHTLVNKSFVSYVVMKFLVQFSFTMLTATLSFYVKYNLHLSGVQQSMILLGALGVALPFVYVWGYIVPKLGAYQSTILAIVLFAIALVPFYFIHTFIGAVICGLFIGVGLSGNLILTDVLLSDVIDEDALKTGARREGVFYGISGVLVGLSTPAQAGVTTLVLALTHYRHAAVVRVSSSGVNSEAGDLDEKAIECNLLKVTSNQ